MFDSSSDPVFDEATGRPLNPSAELVCAEKWASGEASEVSDLPSEAIASATGNWDKHNQLGGGGSCVVYRGQLYGKTDATRLPDPLEEAHAACCSMKPVSYTHLTLPTIYSV